MTEILGELNSEVTAVLPAEIQANWSRARCWHGEKVGLSVICRFVPDGTAAEVSILAQNGDAEVDKLTDLTIRDGKLDKQYAIAWADKRLPENATAFVAKVVIGRHSVRTPVLMVDLNAPVFSN